MSENGFETVSEMRLRHLPDNAKLLIQRQRHEKIPDDRVQFGLPTTFVNAENGQTVFVKGPSIQLEQIPELVGMLTGVYEKYSGEKLSETKSGKTYTFADAAVAAYGKY